MATIDDLNTSISEMPPHEAMDLIHGIRAQRRVKGKPKTKKAPAKTKRAPKKTKLREQDMFAMVGGMSKEAKLELAKKLMGGK